MKKQLYPIFALLLAIIPLLARADGCYIPRIDPNSHAADITEPTQKAVIAHFGNHERMVLQVSYRGKVSEFAWLVPTPARPQVKLFYKPIFHYLHDLTAPRLEYWLYANELVHAATMGVFGAAAGSHDAKVADAGKVDVLELKHIGVYNVAVLRAQDADDLIAWLRDNNYRITPRIRSVLAYYIRKGWIFTAARIDIHKQKAAASSLHEGTIDALQFDFETKQPIYPLKISSVNRGKTNILLYVYDEHRVNALPLRTICVRDASQGLSAGRYLHVLDADDPLPGYEWKSEAYLTKLAGEMKPEQMKKDIILTRARTDDTVIVPNVSPGFLENLGAICMFCILIPFACPMNFITMMICMGFALKKNGSRCFVWTVLAIYSPCAAIVSPLVISPLVIQPLDRFGYWPIGVAAIALVCVRILLRQWKRRRKASMIEAG